jgi:hypothetical protein
MSLFSGASRASHQHLLGLPATAARGRRPVSRYVARLGVGIGLVGIDGSLCGLVEAGAAVAGTNGQHLSYDSSSSAPATAMAGF